MTMPIVLMVLVAVAGSIALGVALDTLRWKVGHLQDQVTALRSVLEEATHLEIQRRALLAWGLPPDKAPLKAVVEALLDHNKVAPRFSPGGIVPGRVTLTPTPQDW